MSSIQSAIAQNPTRTFVTLNGTYGSSVTSDVLDALLATAGADNVGSVYTIYTATAFNTFTVLSNSASVYYNRLVVGETLTDMGKQVTVGLDGVDSCLLKFRSVKRTKGGAVDDPVDGDVEYVVVENNVSKSQQVNHTLLMNSNSFVAVARV